MKRFIATILVITMILSIAACSESKEQASSNIPDTTTVVTQEPSTTIDIEETAGKTKIGFCLAGEGSFYQQLIKDIESECSELNYEAVISTALTAEDQNNQLSEMIAADVSAVVLDPVDVDALESILGDFETQDIPVINIIESINGIVSTLITPDYLSIGKSAGRDAVELFGDTKGQCLLIKTGYDSFSMQLMTDGFIEEIDKDKDVTLFSEEYCGDDEQKAYSAAKQAIEAGEVDFIFAQSDTLGLGALRAIDETASSVKLVVFGGDMQLISAAVDGKIHSCIFYGPKETVKEAVYVADRFVKSAGYVPDQYIELGIEAAQGEDAPKYFIEDGLYAQTIGS